MGLFGRPKPDQDLIERLEKCEKAVRDIRLDWDDTYEKFARLNQRLAKRIRDHDKRERESDDDTNGRSPVNPLAQRLLNPYGARK